MCMYNIHILSTYTLYYNLLYSLSPTCTTGELIMGGSILLPQPPVFTEKTQPDGSSVNTITLSPTLRYAGANEFSPKNK